MLHAPQVLDGCGICITACASFLDVVESAAETPSLLLHGTMTNISTNDYWSRELDLQHALYWQATKSPLHKHGA